MAARSTAAAKAIPPHSALGGKLTLEKLNNVLGFDT
jgi:hypothetical protein